MDLIEYANKFTELEYLLRAVYGGTEEGVYIHNAYLTWYEILADIPNWTKWGLNITKQSKNPKGYILRTDETLKGIGGKDLTFGFLLPENDKKYLVSGFQYW